MVQFSLTHCIAIAIAFPAVLGAEYLVGVGKDERTG
jgi:hypothetical protein